MQCTSHLLYLHVYTSRSHLHTPHVQNLNYNENLKMIKKKDAADDVGSTGDDDVWRDVGGDKDGDDDGGGGGAADWFNVLNYTNI